MSFSSFASSAPPDFSAHSTWTKDDATPQQLFDLEGAAYEPSSDGQRFLLGKPVDDPIRVPLTYVSNWIARAR